MSDRDYTLTPVAPALGGGWAVCLLEDGAEVDHQEFQDHDEALALATVWISEGADE